MPIQFRCTGCNQKLAITRRKAGKKVKCPACAAEISVPTLEEAVATGDFVESPKPSTKPPQKPIPPPEPPPLEPPAEQSLPQDDELPDEITESIFDQLTEDEFTEENKETFTPPEADDIQTEEVVQSEDESEFREDFVEEAPAAYEPSLHRDADEEEDEEEGFHLHRRGMDESGLDMTPMVDVTFLLLIFFMITATFSLQKSMETEAPEPEDEGAAQLPTMDDFADDSVIVEIDENDVIFVDDVQIAGIGELVDVLELKFASEDKTEMIIDPHPQATHGTVVQATDAGIEVGMQRIRRVSRQGGDD